MTNAHPRPAKARDRLLDAGIDLVRSKGFADTSVDDFCRAAGVTKGAFFHHFASKEALGAALADHWSTTTSALFAAAPYHQPKEPLDRILGYIDLRGALISGPTEAFTCLVGTMVQEAYQSSDAIRQACAASIFGHAQTLEADFAAAIAAYGVTGTTAESLARFTQAALQGGFILAKAQGDPAPAREAVDHLKRYILLLFGKETPSGHMTTIS